MRLGVATGSAASIAHSLRTSDKRRSTLAAAVRPCVEMMEQRRMLAGNLDGGFGTGGIATTPALGDQLGQAVAVQSDDKIVVAGFAGNDFIVARYNTDGSPDGSFGSGGVATATFDDPMTVGDDLAQANDVAIDSLGRIIVVGLLQGDDTRFAVARFESDGDLDISFTTAATAFGSLGSAVATAVAIQPDNKIVVAGQVSGNAFALARYVNDQLDGTFADDPMTPAVDGGTVVEDFGGDPASASAVLVQANGKILVAGAVQSGGGDNDFAFARYNANGALDLTFDGDGLKAVPFAGGGEDAVFALTESGGHIIAAGTADDNAAFGLARLNSADGSLDNGFSGDGLATASFFGDLEFARGVAVDSNGNIVAGGVAVNGGAYDFAVARFDSNGSPDAGFSGDGKVTTAVGLTAWEVADMAIDSNDRVIVAGSSFGDDFDFTVAVYEGDDGPVEPAAVIIDPFNSSKSALVVNGTENSDTIVVALAGSGALQGSLSGTIQFGALAPLPNMPFGRVIIHANGGADVVVMASLGIPAVVFGGAGNDSILTGGGNDILVGGDGNDRLYAGGGNDLIIGGNGADILRGDAGNDILISGTTDYDGDLFALNDIVTGVLAPSASFMHDDAARDTLTGNQGIDRFFANQADINEIADLVTDQSGSEDWEDLI